jgi:hypothetical protein
MPRQPYPSDLARITMTGDAETMSKALFQNGQGVRLTRGRYPVRAHRQVLYRPCGTSGNHSDPVT